MTATVLRAKGVAELTQAAARARGLIDFTPCDPSDDVDFQFWRNALPPQADELQQKDRLAVKGVVGYRADLATQLVHALRSISWSSRDRAHMGFRLPREPGPYGHPEILFGIGVLNTRREAGLRSFVTVQSPPGEDVLHRLVVELREEGILSNLMRAESGEYHVVDGDAIELQVQQRRLTLWGVDAPAIGEELLSWAENRTDRPCGLLSFVISRGSVDRIRDFLALIPPATWQITLSLREDISLNAWQPLGTAEAAHADGCHMYTLANDYSSGTVELGTDDPDLERAARVGQGRGASAQYYTMPKELYAVLEAHRPGGMGD